MAYERCRQRADREADQRPFALGTLMRNAVINTLVTLVSLLVGLLGAEIGVRLLSGGGTAHPRRRRFLCHGRGGRRRFVLAGLSADGAGPAGAERRGAGLRHRPGG